MAGCTTICLNCLCLICMPVNRCPLNWPRDLINLNVVLLFIEFMSKQNQKKQIRKPATVKPAAAAAPSVSFKYYYIFLFAFTFLLYANTLHHEYAFDDAAAIVDNPYTKAG